MNNKQQGRGFIRLIVIIVIALIALGYFGYDIRDIFSPPTVHGNLVTFWNWIVSGWNWLIEHLKALSGN